MKKTLIAAVAALAFMLPACGDDGSNDNWQATPGAAFKVGSDAAVLGHLPGVDCSALDDVSSTYKGKIIVRILDLPTPTTAMVRDETNVYATHTVDRQCLAPLTLN